MLVNIHKLALLLFLWITLSIPAQAQVWTLQQCLDTALVNNKNLKMSRNSVDISRQKQSEAKANLLPKVNVSADYKYFSELPYQLMPQSVFGGPEGQFKEAQFGVPHNINANIQMTLPLYNPQVMGAIHTSEIASELSELQYQKTEEQVSFEVANLYYNAQILYHQLSFIDSNLANANKLLANMKLLKQHLLAKGTDVNKVQLQAEQLITQKERINSQYAQVVNALKITIGVPLEYQLEVDPNIADPNQHDYATSPSIDVRIASTQQRLISSELNTLRNTKLPSVSLFGSYGTSGFGYDEKPNEFLRFYPISFAGLQVSFPLFNGTVTQRKINQKKLEISNSELQESLLAEQTDMKIENATQQRVVAQKAVDNTSGQVLLAQSVYDQTVVQQKEGTASLTDILQADNALREAQQTNLSAMVDYLKADLELRKLTGNLLITR